MAEKICAYFFLVFSPNDSRKRILVIFIDSSFFFESLEEGDSIRVKEGGDSADV